MLRRLLLHALIAAAAAGSLSLGSPWAAAASADAAQVTVVSPGGASQTLALDALAGSEDVVGRPYALRSAAGESSQAVTGFSLAAILEAAGADPFAFSYLEVQRPAGGAVLLSRDQALDAGAFADGPPVVYATATGTGFLRPSAGPEDLNATDVFEAPQGVSVVLRKGRPLQVKARASTLRTRPGQPVRFSAVVERAGAGEQLSYSWYFDDGHSAGGPEVSHSFAKQGSYDVVVGITSDGNESGASAVVTVQVGAPLAGPDRKGGGRNNTANAPDHGAADGPSTGAGTGGDVGGSAGDSVTQPSSATARSQPPKDRQDQPASGNGTRISGELLSAGSEPVPSRSPEQKAAARRGRLEGDGGGGLPTAAWGLLATLGLLGTGALIEARRLPGTVEFLSLSESKSTRGRSG
ncbi:MAG TPA: PKD domain-containing protein [Solirubrobacterales bacterium]|nr:PKD domain-containing protein [Solirubrobacterales bacterium]